MLQAASMHTTLTAVAEPLTMSSLDIADLTGKRHDHVMRDIRNMLETLAAPNAPKFGAVDHAEPNALKFEGVYTDAKGEVRPCFHLAKRECLILVSGYSVELRARIIDRWMELEAQVAARPVAPTLSANAQSVLAMLARLGGIASSSTIYQRLKHRVPTSAVVKEAVTELSVGGLVDVSAVRPIRGGKPTMLVAIREGAPVPALAGKGRPKAEVVPVMSACPVLRLTEAVEAVLRSAGSQEAKDDAVDAMERLIAQQAPTSVSGALYQVRLLQGAADLVHSWVPESSKGARVSEDYARRINDMAESVSAFLGAIGGRLPESIQAYHPASARA